MAWNPPQSMALGQSPAPRINRPPTRAPVVTQPGLIPSTSDIAQVNHEVTYHDAHSVAHVSECPTCSHPCGGSCQGPVYGYEDEAKLYHPSDEYLCDGGDAYAQAHVKSDLTLGGIEPEDTIAHYHALDGRILVEPSNRVCIYSPRFASVRKVTSVIQSKRKLHMAGLDGDVLLGSQDRLSIASNVNQPLGPEKQIASDIVSSLEDRNLGVGVDNAIRLQQSKLGQLPYESLLLALRGELAKLDVPMLGDYIAAAITWSRNQAAQVFIEDQQAIVQASVTPALGITVYELKGEPRLQIIKCASTADAAPGETVEFTLRFDNIGPQRIGNVTIVDNLTTRLEYVPDSAQCSLDAKFSTVENDNDSLLLRWEIAEPMEPGDTGLIRFRCRVR